MATAQATGEMTAEERKVIFASSLGTVFEWYDFYLYGSLAAIIAKQFFAGLDPSAAIQKSTGHGPQVSPERATRIGTMVTASQANRHKAVRRRTFWRSAVEGVGCMGSRIPFPLVWPQAENPLGFTRVKPVLSHDKEFLIRVSPLVVSFCW